MEKGTSPSVIAVHPTTAMEKGTSPSVIAVNPTVADQAGISYNRYNFVKSVWMLCGLVSFTLFSAVVFMGIEGE